MTLVLTRKKNQKARIDLSLLGPLAISNPALLQEILSQPIDITLCDIRGDKVRVGFDAHELIKVDREEVWHSKKRGNTCMGKQSWQ